MLLIYLGGLDVARLVRAADKVETASKTLADLVAQEAVVQNTPASNISTFLQAATVAAAPYNDANLMATVSAIDLTLSGGKCCQATVRWSITQGGTLRPCKTVLRAIGASDPWAIDTIPSSIANQTTVPVNGNQTYASAVIVTDVSYLYRGASPLVSKIISQTLWRHAYAIPRLAGQVTLTSTSGLASGQSGAVC